MVHPASSPGSDFAAHRLSVAPMMECTDRNYRYLARLITKRTLLWTEMIVSDALVTHEANNETRDLERLLGYSREEHPLALQLGGSDPELLAKASALCVSRCELEELNLNCGCPSERVGGKKLDESKQFGARLMHKPETVKHCVHAMARAAGNVPVTVKCRLGTNQVGGYENLCNFVREVSEGGAVKHFIIHSRDCVLDKFTPRENRSIPPLRPRWAHRLQNDFPHLVFDINGGIKSLEMALAHVEPAPGDSGGAFVPPYGSYNALWQGDDQQNRAEEDSEWGDLPPVGGVMIGREAWSRPWMLCDADVRVFGEKCNTGRSRRDVLEEYCRYAERMVDEYDSWGVKTNQRNFMKPIFGIFALEPGGNNFRRQIDMEWVGKGFVGKMHPSATEMVEAAMKVMSDDVLDRVANEGMVYHPTKAGKPATFY